jgi:excisionase family DNA binding protein
MGNDIPRKARPGLPGNIITHWLRRTTFAPGKVWFMQSPVSSLPGQAEPLLTPSEVAALFRVDPKTVTRWARAGRLSAIRTMGGHRRYRESDIKKMLEPEPPDSRS